MVIDTSALPAIFLDEIGALAYAQLWQVSFDIPQLDLAQHAWLRFGRGFHAARLNFGDCASYALPRFCGEPLLFVGDEFCKTDIPGVRFV